MNDTAHDNFDNEDFLRVWAKHFNDPLPGINSPLQVVQYVGTLLETTAADGQVADGWKLNSALDRYDSLWWRGTKEQCQLWLQEINQNGSTIETVQKKLSALMEEKFGAGSGVVGLEWRFRLNKWREDHNLIPDTIQIIRNAKNSQDSRQAIELLYHMTKGVQPEHEITGRVEKALWERFFRSLGRKIGESQILWEEEVEANIELLAFLSHYAGRPGIVDASVMDYLERKVLPLNMAAVRLLQKMYGRGREKTKPGAETSAEKNKSFQVQKQFAPLPAEQYHMFRGKVRERMMQVFQEAPGTVTGSYVKLLWELNDGMPDQHDFTERIQKAIRQYMTNIRIPANNRQEVYQSIRENLSPKTHERIWRDTVERLRWLESLPDPNTRDEEALLVSVTREIGSLGLTRLLREPVEQEYLTRAAKKIALEQLDRSLETMGEIDAGLETPILALHRNLYEALVRDGEKMETKPWYPDRRGIIAAPVRDWEKHLDQLPDFSGLTPDERQWRQYSDLLERTIRKHNQLKDTMHQRVVMSSLGEIERNYDPLVFRQVPRVFFNSFEESSIPGIPKGQEYFGFLMRKLSERSVSKNDHYLPYVRDVLQFLSYDRLMIELGQPGMQTAVKKNPDLAATIMQHLYERAMENPHLLRDREFGQQMQLLHRYAMEGNKIQPPKDMGHKPVNMEAGIPSEKSRPPVPGPYPGGLGR